ncbi:hypothetical protein PRIPAC_96035 [Pristionchus pacificus]|uniref:RNA binding protein n=1 Tax=Pristionchus pacificus TaxID=54126 RepID=A0A454XXR6_PRIPA|nr:hypothetical protein PRIPAC_96035 [Pristionchus pacificus]|eukprot:PDM60241.1 RNA binding protein [Pristionchus pacificus]
MDEEDTIVAAPDTSTEAAQEVDSEDTGRSLYVGYLPHETDEDTLKVFMAQAGEVSSVRIVRNAETGPDKGYGIVEFVDPPVAKNAIDNLNGAPRFQGRAIRVKLASDVTEHQVHDC